MKGSFILSINDHPDVREIFKGFSLEAVTTTYGISGGATAARELIITPRPA